MILRTEQLLWLQWNGLQGNSLITCILQFFQSMINGLAEYFSQWSIASANSQHLSIMGTLLNIPRGLTRSRSADDPWFRFTYDKDIHSSGFGPPGGLIVEQQIDAPIAINPIPTEIYRSILKQITGSGGSLNSLQLLDYLCSIILTAGTYEFVWMDTDLIIQVRDINGDEIVTLRGFFGLWIPAIHITVEEL